MPTRSPICSCAARAARPGKSRDQFCPSPTPPEIVSISAAPIRSPVEYPSWSHKRSVGLRCQDPAEQSRHDTREAVAVANAEAHQQVLDYARQLERSLLIRGSLAKFVPQRVRELIEESPEAPSLDKRETDVSVLFADISGYTRLSSRLAPDDLDALVQRYFGAFLDEIVKHGGDVNETAGDGLMVIFHEGDHARAAVDAARAIHRRAAEIGSELAHRFDPLRMHIGVNTGPALLGATKIEGRAGTRWTYTASGMTTNIAARLAAQAQGGEIVLSGETRARLFGDLALEEMGLRELKGVEQPLPLYRLR